MNLTLCSSHLQQNNYRQISIRFFFCLRVDFFMESRNKIAKNLSLPFHNQSQSKEEKAMNNLSPLTHISLLRLLILSGSHDLDGPGHVKIG